MTKLNYLKKMCIPINYQHLLKVVIHILQDYLFSINQSKIENSRYFEIIKITITNISFILCYLLTHISNN